MVKRNATQARLDRTFQALADPTRRHMLKSLAAGDRRVGELARPHALSPPAISKHLQVLENAGLVRRRRRGNEHWVELRTQSLKRAHAWLAFYEDSAAPQLEALEGLLLSGRGKPRD